MTALPVVWVTEPIHEQALLQLSQQAKVVGPGPLPVEYKAQVQAIIVRAASLSATVLAELPALQVVGKHGAGVDNIATDFLAQHKIPLLTAAGFNADSVADLTVALALMLLRAPDVHDQHLRAAETAPLIHGYVGGIELAQLSIGIVGMGAIGQAVAQRFAAGFGARVAGFDPFLPESRWPLGLARHSSLQELLTQSNLVCLHLPLSESTRLLIGAQELQWIPRGGFLVNCSRGGIVDELALADALKSGHLAGAASDVFATEPPDTQHPLFSAGRFIATPHIGGATEAALFKTGSHIVNEVLAVLTAP